MRGIRLGSRDKVKISRGTIKGEIILRGRIKLYDVPGTGGNASDDFRLLEDGFIRLLENGDLRILE